ncbi:hypothetical protein ACFSHT_32250 [Paraburkholderia silviterrae]|uniref:ABC transporter substrate-binding protein n=1 Tax=Paraburkholderia silviterrae TaxID=2528715 RepID=A0A4R5M2M3_9BURK|nr:hypothetical protein [Paraburkholderia silviterrae]TDG19731.1 hypothetical protein EYW47_29645 [Paraburkholderia silviterrae]
MKRVCSAVLLVVLTVGCAACAGCASTQPPVNDQSARRAPRLSVGVSDPNTQLILPWFLTDLINAVNDP